MRPSRALYITTVLLLLLAIQRQQTQLLAFALLTERWLNESNRLLAASLLRARNRRLRRLRRAPYAWSLQLQRSHHPRVFLAFVSRFLGATFGAQLTSYSFPSFSSILALQIIEIVSPKSD